MGGEGRYWPEYLPSVILLLGYHLEQNAGESENNLNVCKKGCAEKRVVI